MISCTFNGQRWRAYEVNRLGAGGNSAFGDCDHDKQIIRAVRGQTEQEFLDTFCHEALHAEFPFLDEDAVTAGGTNIARFLWKLGYRREAK